MGFHKQHGIPSRSVGHTPFITPSNVGPLPYSYALRFRHNHETPQLVGTVVGFSVGDVVGTVGVNVGDIVGVVFVATGPHGHGATDSLSGHRVRPSCRGMSIMRRSCSTLGFRRWERGLSSLELNL